jgi:LysR family hydrogen peroxide-inducible transcriptional activator
MNIRDLKYLVQLAKHQHFTKAAEESFVSQSALSMQIKKLEEELGVQIFERSKRNFVVTKIGEKIIERAEVILFEVEEIKNLAKNSKNIFASEVTIGAFPTLAPYFFPKIIGKIHKKFPQLKIFLTEEKSEILLNKLKQGKLDTAMLAGPILDDDLEKIKIFEEDFLLATPKKHHLAKYKKLPITKLSNESLLLLEDGHCMRSQALEVCSFVGAFERDEFRATSLETLRQMVEIGGGITLIPEIATKKSAKICYVKITPAPKREVFLCFRKKAANAELLRLLGKEMSDGSL